MTIETHTPNRKVLAQAIAEEIHADVRYLGTPSYAYRVGAYTIDRDAAIHGDDFEPLRAFLLQHEYITAGTILNESGADAAQDEAGEIPEGTSEEAQEASPAIDSKESVGMIEQEEVHSDSEIPESTQDDFKEVGEAGLACDDYTATTTFKFAETDTPQIIINYLRMLYARQDLIAAMTGSKLLRLDEEVITLLNELKPNSFEAISKIVQDEARLNMISGLEMQSDRLTLIFESNINHDAPLRSWLVMLCKSLEVARKAKHVNAKRVTPAEDEMKYCCHTWLMQLQMGGPDFKEDRKALLGHLSGYAAFRSNAKMEAHKEKYKLLRHEHAADLKAEEVDGNV